MFRTFAIACLTAMAYGMRKDKVDEIVSQIKAKHDAKKAAEAEGKQKHNCHSAADRNKQIPPEFGDYINSQYRFQDLEFTASTESLFWDDMDEELPEDLKPSQVTWARAFETFAPRGRTLFGDGITTDDINQGSLGNCWFLSAAAAIAEFPGRMERVFLNSGKDLNPQGIYGVRFWSLGVPHPVIVDDYLPLKNNGVGQLATMFANPGDDGSLWTAILEKAFAKYHGNYAHIEGGEPFRAVKTMTGAPYMTYSHKDHTPDQLWERLSKHDARKDIMTAGSPAGSDKTTDKTGLVQGHAFTVSGVKVLSNGVRLVKCRNPWGAEKFHGNWSDSDPRWTPELRAEAGMKIDKEDGSFFMTIEDY